ncbi:MAG TPA: LON peptidase substrate-binding domain-containing protein [Gemmatimonadaceae bacterium]|nr:LON peptidase substrate-binding domain-containing protein [Gemmatimonadaceae bacterium]
MPERELALFPLAVVLFPQAPMPLHIFEPRYRRLMEDCLAGDKQFGILPKLDDKPEKDIAPGTVGCIAEIEQTQELPDGRSNVLLRGGERFSLVRFVPSNAPYFKGIVTDIPDDEVPAYATRDLAGRVRDLFGRVATAARTIADDRAPVPDLPNDDKSLAFVVAQYLDLDLTSKYRVLASRSPVDRLRQIDGVLSPIVETIEDRATVHTRARSNGHGHGAGA